MTEEIKTTRIVRSDMALRRIDQVAGELLPQYSRARIQSWLKSGELLVNGKAVKPKAKVRAGDLLQLNALIKAEADWDAEKIDLSAVFEDEQLLVINKPADFVVHPAPGHRQGTVVNALLHRCPELRALPRAGLVHRLDKDTTGLMVIAKTLEAHQSLVKQLQSRSMGREYEAIVWGKVTGSGKVDRAIGRSPANRQKMAIVEGGKPAVTHFKLIESFAGCCHLRLKLETGRTHQIRVHMASIKHPLIGDKAYGKSPVSLKTMCPPVRKAVLEFPRQALHAKSLGLIHPNGTNMVWETALPPDMLDLIDLLQQQGAS